MRKTIRIKINSDVALTFKDVSVRDLLIRGRGECSTSINF
jgi:hypothetical protein